MNRQDSDRKSRRRSLRALAASSDRAVAFEAMVSLAEWASEQGDLGYGRGIITEIVRLTGGRAFFPVFASPA